GALSISTIAHCPTSEGAVAIVKYSQRSNLEGKKAMGTTNPRESRRATFIARDS
ncbi:Hypothetical predicted protein, partial [Olea europaea subsp. europaea]